MIAVVGLGGGKKVLASSVFILTGNGGILDMDPVVLSIRLITL